MEYRELECIEVKYESGYVDHISDVWFDLGSVQGQMGGSKVKLNHIAMNIASRFNICIIIK